MRINLSFHSNSESSLSPKEDSGHEKFCSMAWIIENMKPKCLGREKRRKKKTEEWRQQKQRKVAKGLSLKEWFTVENNGFKRLSAGDSPSVARESACFYDSGDYSFSLEQLLSGSDSTLVAKSAYSSDSVDHSFSLEKLLKGEDVDAAEKGFYALTSGQTCKEEKEFYSLTRNQSCKERKRVSFRLPEVSDIVILYSPDVNNSKNEY